MPPGGRDARRARGTRRPCRLHRPAPRAGIPPAVSLGRSRPPDRRDALATPRSPTPPHVPVPWHPMLPPNAGSERKNADIKYIADRCFRRAAADPYRGRHLFPPSPRPNIPRCPHGPRIAWCPPSRPRPPRGTLRTLARGTERALARGTQCTLARRPRQPGQERLIAPSAVFTDAAFAITSVRPIRVRERGAGN